MLFEEKETNLLESFRLKIPQDILLISNDEETRQIVESIHDDAQWKEWTDASAKNAPPPDFYNDSKKIMLEVMRVDDHGFKKEGKISNPNYERQRRLERELHASGIMDVCPNLEHVFINAVTELPTLEDHNYVYYRDNFVRTISHHKERIPLYRKNHPNYSLVFFVFDESSAYFEAERETNTFSENGSEFGRPHVWFIDEAFVDAIGGCSIDYLIWYTLYKGFEYIEPRIELPQACVFRCNTAYTQTEIYAPSRMVSSEN